MSKLSEEEIIHCIKLCIENNGIPSEGINWVKGLLDLYNKEKEKSKEYEKYYKCERNLLDNYISKDKIRDKIEELEKEIEEKQENCLDFTIMYEHEIDTNAIIKVLQELLEEGETNK